MGSEKTAEADPMEIIERELEPAAAGSLTEEDLVQAAMEVEIGQEPTLKEEIQEGADSSTMNVNTARGYRHADDVKSILDSAEHAYLRGETGEYDEKLDDPAEFYGNLIGGMKEIFDSPVQEKAQDCVNVYGEDILARFHSENEANTLREQVENSQPVHVFKFGRTRRNTSGKNPVLDEYVCRMEVYVGGDMVTSIDATLDRDTVVDRLVNTGRSYVGRVMANNGKHVTRRRGRVRDELGWEKPDSGSILDYLPTRG
ncbi:MAG: hypothetical protein ABEI58_00015 [Candidatus Nanohaloarchaea archaeon]